MSRHYLRNDADIVHLEQDAARVLRRDDAGIDELLAENEQLRTLVVELSRIVARSALERK